MTAKITGRRLSPRTRRAIITATVLVAISLLVVVEVVRPNLNARSYTDRLTSSSKPLEDCFDKLAETTGLEIYYAPDIPIETKQRNVTDILGRINTCRTELKNFDKAARELAAFHLAGYTGTYRTAQVNQRQAFDVIGQSNDVMNQYADLANFLAQYYEHIKAFLDYTSTVNNLDATYSSDRIQVLREQEADLRRRAGQISQLKAPAGFDKTKQASHDMFITAADGLDYLATGIFNGSDLSVNFGYDKISQALAAYDGTVVNLPFDQLTTSYIPKQVLQLPVKVKDLLATSSE